MVGVLTARLGVGDNGAATATDRNELAALKFMFSLAAKAKRLHQRSYFPSLSVGDTRKGVFEEDDFKALHKQLPVYLKNPFAFAYHTGWRVKSEIVPLRCHQVDFKAGVVTPGPGTVGSRGLRIVCEAFSASGVSGLGWQTVQESVSS